MKCISLFSVFLIIMSIMPLAYADSASRGAFWGGVTGAAIGGSAGGPTGAVLGGLGGAALGGSIGASRDRQRYEYVDQYGRPVQVRRVYRRPVPAQRVIRRQYVQQPVQPMQQVKPVSNQSQIVYVK